MYTYEDFQKAVTSAGMSGQFSDYDLKLAQKNPDAGMSILKNKIDYGKATTDEERTLINAKTEELRKAYGGYSGGRDGSGYNVELPTEYKVQSSFDNYVNSEPFSYNAEKDDLYKAYKKTYRREGERASANTLSQAAAMTGGIPSSYAVTAGQQAGNYYASQMADKIPELESLAYNRYQNEQNEKLNKLNALLALDERNYEREQDAYNREKSEEATELENAKYQASLGNFTPLEELLGYPVSKEYKDAYLYSLTEPKKENEYQKTLDLAKLSGEYGDYSKLKNLGVDVSDEFVNPAQNPQDYYAELYSKYKSTVLPSWEWTEENAEGLARAGFTRKATEGEISDIKGTTDAQLDGNDVYVDSKYFYALLDKGYTRADLNDNGIYMKEE